MIFQTYLFDPFMGFLQELAFLIRVNDGVMIILSSQKWNLICGCTSYPVHTLGVTYTSAWECSRRARGTLVKALPITYNLQADLFDPSIRFSKILPTRLRVNLGVIVTKWWFLPPQISKLESPSSVEDEVDEFQATSH